MASEMGIFETIYNCRAIENLTPEVPQEDLEKLISAANKHLRVPTIKLQDG